MKYEVTVLDERGKLVRLGKFALLSEAKETMSLAYDTPGYSNATITDLLVPLARSVAPPPPPPAAGPMIEAVVRELCSDQGLCGFPNCGCSMRTPDPTLALRRRAAVIAGIFLPIAPPIPVPWSSSCQSKD